MDESERASAVARHAPIWRVEVDEQERAARWCIWSGQGIGAQGMQAVLARCGGELAGLWKSGARAATRDLRASGVNKRLVTRLEEVLAICPMRAWEDEQARLPAGASIVHLCDKDYPPSFWELTSPPVFLYVWGQLEVLSSQRRVAIVGSRVADQLRRELAESMAARLSQSAILVISGGALGIDACAHEGSLLDGGQTVAFLPGGLGCLTPPRHRELFERIATQGAVVSEYPLGVGARPYHFARRNQLIAALSEAVVVVCAAIGSGTMITAEAGAKLGRLLCVVPAAIDDALAQGSLELLVAGALAVRDGDDVWRHVYEQEDDRPAPLLRARRAPAAPAGPTGDRPVDVSGLALDKQQVLLALDALARATGERDVHVDELARHLGWAVMQVSTALVELEINQRVQKMAGTNAYRLLGG
ncbi:MAG: DNA-protecting protein DprA [Bradymonadaceae bacterium]|nr:DNA-protecting protein DprA [Lujinxingiaceae bacterium]